METWHVALIIGALAVGIAVGGRLLSQWVERRLQPPPEPTFLEASEALAESMREFSAALGREVAPALVAFGHAVESLGKQWAEIQTRRPCLFMGGPADGREITVSDAQNEMRVADIWRDGAALYKRSGPTSFVYTRTEQGL